jgi:hypothetical protein
MAAIESPLSGSIGMANDVLPSPSAGAPRQQGGGHAPSPHLNPLQFGKGLFGGGEGAAAEGGAEAGAGAALEELAPLALAAL